MLNKNKLQFPRSMLTIQGLLTIIVVIFNNKNERFNSIFDK